MPQHLSCANLEPYAPPPQVELDPQDSFIFQGAMRDALHEEDLQHLRAMTSLPLLAKGVLHPQDGTNAQTNRCLMVLSSLITVAGLWIVFLPLSKYSPLLERLLGRSISYYAMGGFIAVMIFSNASLWVLMAYLLAGRIYTL